MDTIRRKASAGLAWLAAAMTVVAGAPHLECHCPNGQVHPLYLLLGSRAAGCCCPTHGGRSAGQGRIPDCCAGRPDGGRPVGRPLSVGRACCVRTLAAGAAPTLLPEKPSARAGRTWEVVLHAPHAAGCCGTRLASGRFTDLSHPPAPSIDRITLLQRLLI